MGRKLLQWVWCVLIIALVCYICFFSSFLKHAVLTPAPLPDKDSFPRTFPDYHCLLFKDLVDVPSAFLIDSSALDHPNLPIWQRHQRKQGIVGFLVPRNTTQNETGVFQTSDNWPKQFKNYFGKKIPRSPFQSKHRIQWNYDTSLLTQLPDVTRNPPKLITWVEPPRHIPPLPEPVHLRVCPEMPCRVTTNPFFMEQSAALLWSVEHMRSKAPPKRSHSDQVFVFHNLEPPRPVWACSSTYLRSSWISQFNWTMTYRFDSDILSVHGLIARRRQKPDRNYTEILAKKTKLAAWFVSSVINQSNRKEYVAELKKYIPVDVFGGKGNHSCPRDKDDECLERISREYKFYLAFESSFCKYYITEKFFRYLQSDAVVVARGSNEYKYHAPPEIFINTADFKTVKDLADHLLYLDKHPEEYLKILKAKDEYDVLYEDYPLRTSDGRVTFMHYQYEATAFCEMCRRLWNLDSYRQTIPDIAKWFQREFCYLAKDIR